MPTRLALVEIEIEDNLYRDMQRVFGVENLSDLATRALKKAYGDAKIARLAAEKRAEIEAEAEKLNVELGLKG